jgi:cathepsin A (carboxypeptidase C)
MTGMLAELGPWRTKYDGSGLTWFEHRWTKIANIIFLESPQCVGYSYATTEACSSTDNITALDNHEAMRSFLVKFPEYRANEFFVTGESYAGIYVPTLAARIVDDPDFNFKGFAVGNAVTDDEVMTNAYTYFAWARGLFGTDLWDSLLTQCCEDANPSLCQFYRSNSAQCRVLVARVSNVQWRLGLNPYDVYAECYGGAPDARGVYWETAAAAEVMLADGSTLYADEQYSQFVRALSAAKNVTVRIPCSYTDDRETYLNRADVRAALHVEPEQYWLPCSNIAYVKQYVNVRAEYNKILDRGHRILVFFGDLDMACDHLGGMWFVESLDKQVVEPFKQWFYPDSLGFNQIAGFVSQYDRLTFVSVKGAGHFVPTDSPVAAFQMFERFLTNKPY